MLNSSLKSLREQKEGVAMVSLVLMETRWARTSNFELIGRDDWPLVANKIANDFPELTLGRLHQIIQKGIRGRIGEFRSDIKINIPTIYHWIDMETGNVSKKDMFR